MYKLKLLLLPLAWLLAFMAFACAPPDDDDRSSGPSGPAITSASYDVGTALLTVQGTDLSPTEAQIQTIVVDGVALDSYTADDPATGPDSSDLAKGKYRIKSDGTAIWLKLKDQHKATLNGKVGSNGLKKGLLSVGTGAWAGLNTAKDLEVSNVPENKQSKVSDDNQPSKQTEEAEQDEQAEEVEQAEDKQSKTETEEESPKQPKAEDQSPEAAITGASYHVGTALLTLQGNDLGSATQAQIQTITVDGLAFSSYIADATATGADSRSLAKGKYRIKNDGTAIWLKLTDTDKAALNGKTGMDSNGLKDGLLTSTGAWAGLDTAKGLAVSGHPPTITRASYDVGTALLTVQGTNLSPTEAQIQTIVVDGLALISYTADTTATGVNSNGLEKGKYRIKNDGTALWLYLTDRHKDALNGKTGMDSNGLKDGLLTSTGTWAGLDTAKGLAVSGNPAPAITRATYNVNTGSLKITGTNLPKAVTGWDFRELTIVSGDGKKRLTLSRYTIGSAASATSLKISLNRAKANAILVKDGDSDDAGAYNLEAAAGFVPGSSAEDTSNPITVSGNTIASAEYNPNTGKLTIVGKGLPTTIAEWDFSKLTIVSRDGTKRLTLPRHSTVGENRATGTVAVTKGVIIILSGSVKTNADAIMQDRFGHYKLEAAAGFVPGGPADPTVVLTRSS